MAYAPLIWRVIQSRRARGELVLSTWWLWTACALAEWGYALRVAHQDAWAGVAVLHTLACATVAALGTWEQLRTDSSVFTPIEVRPMSEDD